MRAGIVRIHPRKHEPRGPGDQRRQYSEHRQNQDRLFSHVISRTRRELGLMKLAQ